MKTYIQEITDNEAIVIFTALKKAGKIKGNEYYPYMRKLADSRLGKGGGVAISHYSKKAKADFIRSLDNNFYRKARIYVDIYEMAEKVYERSIANGGSTTFVDTGLPVTTGYIVAGLGAPSVLTKTLSPEIIDKYIRDNYEQWFKDTNMSKRYFLGTWLNPEDNTWYIDVSHDAGSPKEAERLCRERGELAYYDMLADESVYVDNN